MAFARALPIVFGALVIAGFQPAQERTAAVERPFGTLREQAATQQQWLRKRLDTFLPALMRKYGSISGSSRCV